MYTSKSEKEDDNQFLSIKIHNNSVEIESEAPEGIDPFEFKVCGFGSQSDSPVSELEGICTLFDSIFVYQKISHKIEVIIVNDGSTDASLSILK